MKRVRFAAKMVEVKATVQHPVRSVLSYLISNGKQSWDVPISQVTIKDEETLIMPRWLAVKKGIPISHG